MPADLFTYFLQGGSFALVAWLIFHHNSKTIPKFLEVQGAMAASFAGTIEKVNASVQSVVDKFTGALGQARQEAREERQAMQDGLVRAVERLEKVVVDHDRDMRAAHSDEYRSLIDRVLLERGVIAPSSTGARKKKKPEPPAAAAG